jgi:NAD dependent epimerase/dehydratase family enzyme
LNITAPTPVTNRELAQALGRALHRPSLVPAPAFALRLALGEMASAVLDGQRALPAKAQTLGFTFGYPTLDRALQQLYA